MQAPRLAELQQAMDGLQAEYAANDRQKVHPPSLSRPTVRPAHTPRSQRGQKSKYVRRGIKE